MNSTQTLQSRIDSIDVLRGIAMVVMALDHVRDFFHITANTADPLDLNITTPELFFTRWITHFCAPIFVFLSGTSIFLQSLRKTKSELSSFLIKRGLWLVFAEVVIITLGWSFNPYYNIHFLQVIWTIGISMVILGILIWLPYNIILVLGLIIVLGHNLLDIPESAPDFKPNFIWDLLHHGFFTPYTFAPGHSVLIIYPFVAWTGVMMLGYCAGIFFTTDYTPAQRKKLLNITGFVLIFLFIALRFFNIYGDPNPWSSQGSLLHSLFSFISVDKYPPSLLFLFVTIGPSLLLLAMLEQTQNRITQIFRVYGRTAFFYYILHIYLIHLLATISFFMNGHTLADVPNLAQKFPFLFLVPGEGYDLPVVYLVWLLVVIMLYPVCKWYDRYKTAHKEKWWLSYL